METDRFEAITHKVMRQLDLEGVVIPPDIVISTMTMDAKLNIEFDATNIYKYIKTSHDRIMRINPVIKERKRQRKTNRDTIKKKNREKLQSISTSSSKRTDIDKSKRRKNGEEFLNQVTVYVKVSEKDAEHPVSVKIFRNGTLHFTGVKTIRCLLEAVEHICTECKVQRAIIARTKNSNKTKIKQITFVNNPSQLSVSNLYDFAVAMINCSFVVPFRIDRPKLLSCLTADGYNASYDSNGHSAVNIKYLIQDKSSQSMGVKIRDSNDLGKNDERITIFVFESGSIIIILGNQGFRPIKEVYTFIYRYLLTNYDAIVKDDELTDQSIQEYRLEAKQKEMRDIEKAKQIREINDIDEMDDKSSDTLIDSPVVREESSDTVSSDGSDETENEDNEEQKKKSRIMVRKKTGSGKVVKSTRGGVSGKSTNVRK